MLNCLIPNEPSELSPRPNSKMSEKRQSSSGVTKRDLEERRESATEVDAASAYLNHEDLAARSSLDEKALVRKIDWRVILMMWAMYNLQYLDKTLSMSKHCGIS